MEHDASSDATIDADQDEVFVVLRRTTIQANEGLEGKLSVDPMGTI